MSLSGAEGRFVYCPDNDTSISSGAEVAPSMETPGSRHPGVLSGSSQFVQALSGSLHTRRGP